jgi:flavin reductase (DIM6/NTAB) family NADH-FMN oxidoreductase RutF
LGIIGANHFLYDMSSLPIHAPVTEFDDVHFRRALSQFATGVTVITTRDESGGFVGLTASSFNSVSLTPPLVLWSLSDNARSMPLFKINSHYVINVLAADQAHWLSALLVVFQIVSTASALTSRLPGCPCYMALLLGLNATTVVDIPKVIMLFL